MRSRVTAADRANHLWQKEWHDMDDKVPPVVKKRQRG